MHLCLPWVFATVTTLVISAESYPSFPYKQSHSILSSSEAASARVPNSDKLASSRSHLLSAVREEGAASRGVGEDPAYLDVDEDNPKAEISTRDGSQDVFDNILRLKYARTSKRSPPSETFKVFADDKDTNQHGGLNTERAGRRTMVPASMLPENLMDSEGNLESNVRKRVPHVSYRGLSLEIPDSYALRERNRPNWMVFKKNEGPSLSIYSPLEVLRQKMLLEMARRRKEEAQNQIDANEIILKDKGKRSASYWQSSWSSSDNEKEPYRQRNSRAAITADTEGYV